MINEADTEERRRETLTDVWASWALEGRLPTEDDRRCARAYIAGELTLEQIIEATVREDRCA